MSVPAVPLTVTVSTALSPRPEPIAPSSLIATPARGRSVPLTSLITMLSAPPKAWNLIPSTSSRSIVMLAISRVKSTRPPLAKMSMFSAIFAPLKARQSTPAWP